MKHPKLPFVFLAAAFLISALGTSPAGAKEYKYASFTPPKSEVNRFAMKAFIKEVKEKTKGAIVIKNFTGGSLLGARDTLPGIRDGVVMGGFVVPAFVVSSLPHHNLVPDLLSFATDPIQAAGAGNETLVLDCPECIADSAKMKSINFGGYGSQSYWLQCTKEVKKFSDLKGRKVRVAGSASGRWVKAMGAVAVGGMPPPQIVTGMQRGQVDCAIAIPGWLLAMSLKDAVKHVVTHPQGLYHGLGIFTFNLKYWKGLSRETKGIFLRAMANASASSTIINGYTHPAKTLNPIIKKKKIKKWAGDDALRSAWGKFLKAEIPAIIKGAVKRGIKKEAAERIVKAHRANLKKWAKISKEVGMDKNKLAKAMWDNIYSKVKY